MWIGVSILLLDLILSIIEQLRIRKTAITPSDNPEFNEMMDAFCDPDGLAAVKVSFASGILFGFNSSTLSNEAKASLRDLAQILRDDPTTDIAIIGHTDKVGTYEANVKVSKDRAYAVENYLQDCNVSPAQFKVVKGVAYDEYDESKSADENRRVEIYMYASEQMIQEAAQQ